MISNIGYLIIIAFLLLLGGWIFKALIALTQGKPLSINLVNPLNLKARWPKDSQENNES